ncbi:LysR family transcriptional regulator [Sphingobium fuliginis]|jgi:DNA-binding transcriptional LysR family regulator|uniref:LysR family transcriptional regulator n=2 Tax=Sphingobium fuliginis (strain ATCC 27551) TaxID=336203 RepID=A0A7M2GME5_SPHSA|nr:LysR family transcriptional regulator [Sphingobium fuliginis]QDC39639.1 LysR family transcriptional regulator [Sphingobium fuliginis ATCC 27551]QOT73944.1 LysR family transcriptional regulator [Sphingobium fuliginis]
MDRFDAMAMFVRVVERRSFSAAAADRSVSRSAATAAVKQLEAGLGVPLLRRTTRQVVPTQEGLRFYERCVPILAEIEAAEHAATGRLAGTLRVDVAGSLARTILLPALPRFLADNPGLAVQLGEGERFVDMVREGIDCVVRAGELADSGLIARKVGEIAEVTCASPAYLARHGTPRILDDLCGHEMIAFVSSRTGLAMPLEFADKGRTVKVALAARLLVSGADTAAVAALRGFGLVQAPRLRFAEDLRSGALVEVLPSFAPPPTPISVVYPATRQLPPRVRAFIDWLVATLVPALAS